MSASKRIVVCEVSVERHRHVLHRCATSDESFTAKLSGPDARLSALEPRTDALVRISALGAVGAPEALWRSAIARAFDAGACEEDIVATLISIATIIGHARAVSAAPAIARGIGYEIDDALHS